MRRSIYLATFAVASCSAAQAQVVLNETFDDGLAADRFDTRVILPTAPTVVATANPVFNFNYNYGAFNYTSYLTGAPVVQPIPAAPGSVAGSTIGARLNLIPISPAPTIPTGSTGSTVTSMGFLPKAVNVSGDFRIEGYMWMSYNGTNGDQFASQGGSGSTEYMTVGLRRSGDTLTGPFPTGTNSQGYAFTMTGEGGTTTDMRFHNTDTGDDGPSYFKRNGAWYAGITENRYDLTTGNLILIPANATAPAVPNSLIPDLPDNHAHSYYRSEVFRSEDGFEIAGAPAKKWVKFEVEQHGRISTYVVNGKAIGVLFHTESFSGTPQFGYFDRTNGFAPNTTGANGVNNRENQFVLYDNLVATQMEAAPANQITLTKNYAAFGTGGTYTADGAATLSYLEIGTVDAVTIQGSGTLTLGQTLAAVQSIGNGVHTITKPVHLAADTAISVVGDAPVTGTPQVVGTLAIPNLTFAPNIDLSKQGRGTLVIPKLRAKTLAFIDGKIKLTGAGPADASKLDGIQFGYTSTAQLDLGRTVMAIDWADRRSAQDPTKSNNPFSTLLARYISGFAAVPESTPLTPQWNGAGVISSAAEIQGDAYHSSVFTFRIEESNVIGFGDGSTWGATGLPIDASTVLMGLTFKADTNLDQTVNFDDLLKLAQNYGATELSTVTSWVRGDSNGDGAVNFDDLLALAQNYGRTVTSAGFSLNAAMAVSFDGDWALAQSLVPEPASLSLLGLGAVALRRRRQA